MLTVRGVFSTYQKNILEKTPAVAAGLALAALETSLMVVRFHTVVSLQLSSPWENYSSGLDSETLVQTHVEEVHLLLITWAWSTRTSTVKAKRKSPWWPRPGYSWLADKNGWPRWLGLHFIDHTIGSGYCSAFRIHQFEAYLHYHPHFFEKRERSVVERVHSQDGATSQPQLTKKVILTTVKHSFLLYVD